jgi:hypothetical protein
LKQTKTGEAVGALHHPEVGDIDLVWGKEGDPDKSYKGGYGLAKIAAKHPAVLDDLQHRLSAMKVASKDATWITLESEDGKGVVRLDWDGAKKHWLVSAYEKRVGGGKTSDTAALSGKGDTALPAANSEKSIVAADKRGNPGDSDPSSPNYRYRDTGHIAGSRTLPLS